MSHEHVVFDPCAPVLKLYVCVWRLCCVDSSAPSLSCLQFVNNALEGRYYWNFSTYGMHTVYAPGSWRGFIPLNPRVLLESPVHCPPPSRHSPVL